MKAWQLDRKVSKLSEKINDAPSGGVIRLDFDSFSEAEKLLFKKVDEVEEQWKRTGNGELLEKNYDLIMKNFEVILRRVTELYCYVVPTVLGCDGTHEIVEYFFNLHFLNFDADLTECLKHVRTWSEKDRMDFVLDLKKNGSFFFRVPRGFNEHNDGDFGSLVNSKVIKPESDACPSEPVVLDQKDRQTDDSFICRPTLHCPPQCKGEQNVNVDQENKATLGRG